MKTIERIVNDLKSRVKDQDKLIGSTVTDVTKDYLEKYRMNDDDNVAHG